MSDVMTPSQRSRCMSRIRCANTKPEMTVRSMVHRMGYRFRLHRRDLPGRPDIVLPGSGRIILVHGCFWHMHSCPAGRVRPRTNAAFWQSKRKANVARDRLVLKRLRGLGWHVMTVWECETNNPETLQERLREFLN